MRFGNIGMVAAAGASFVSAPVLAQASQTVFPWTYSALLIGNDLKASGFLWNPRTQCVVGRIEPRRKYATP